MLREIFQNTLRNPFKLAGFRVERLQRRPVGEDAYAQRFVVARVTVFGAGQIVVVLRGEEVLLVQGFLELGVALVDAVDGGIKLVDDRALALRRGEEEGPSSERRHDMEPVEDVDVDLEEHVGFAGQGFVEQLLRGGAFDGDQVDAVLIAVVLELRAALLRGGEDGHAQLASGEQIGFRDGGMYVRSEQGGVGRAVAVFGVFVHLGKGGAVRHASFDVHLAVVQHL